MTRSVEGRPDARERARVGLCADCAFAHVQGSSKASSSRFYRCKRADDDPGYMKYPPIPVIACDGHRPSGGEASQG